MAAESSSAKGRKAGKRSNPQSTTTTAAAAGSEAVRGGGGGNKTDLPEVEDVDQRAAPPTKKRRSGADTKLAVQFQQQNSPVNVPATRDVSTKTSRGRNSLQKSRAKQQQEQASVQTALSSVVDERPIIKQDNGPYIEWTNEDLSKLVESLMNLLPKTDSVKYSTQLQRLDWDKVKFGSYSADDCKEKWGSVMTKLRRYRTLTELVGDAKEWVKHPWMAYNHPKTKIKHPDLPKKPLTPYFRYYKEKRPKCSKENPQLSMTDIAKLLAKKFTETPERKKQKYKDGFEKENEIYKKQMEKFREQHPDMFPDGELKIRMPSKHAGPQKPQSPQQLFLAEKLAKHTNSAGSNRKEMDEKYRNQWKNMSEVKKLRWINKAFSDEQRYSAELAEYCIMHPDYKPDPAKCVVSKMEKEIKDRCDGKPDRPPNSGYSLYSKIMLKELKDIPSKEKMAEISRRWKDLSEKERQNFAKKATEAMEKYQRDYKLYVASLPEEDRRKLEDEINNKRKKPSTHSQSSKQTSSESQDAPPTKPKKPMSALFFYQQEKLVQYKAKNPDKSEQEVTRLMAREYGDLSEKKKDKYKKMAEEAKKTNEQTSNSKDNDVKNMVFKGEPKRPPLSSYALFTSELMSKLTDIEPKFRMAEISKRWKSMSDSERDRYKKKAADSQKKYSKDLLKFLATLTEEEKRQYDQQKTKKSRSGSKAKAKKAVVVKQESSSSSEESEKEEEEDEEKNESSDSGSGSDSDSSDSEESESGSDSDSKSEESASEKEEESEAEKEEEKEEASSSSGEENESDDTASSSDSESEDEE